MNPDVVLPFRNGIRSKSLDDSALGGSPGFRRALLLILAVLLMTALLPSAGIEGETHALGLEMAAEEADHVHEERRNVVRRRRKNGKLTRRPPMAYT